METEQIKLVMIVLNMFVSAAVWVFVWIDSRRRVTVDSIKDLEKSVTLRFDSKCLRISKIEADLRALPTTSEITRIHERLDKSLEYSRTMASVLGEISGQIKEMRRAR